MGVVDSGNTLVAPKPKGIIDPNTGKPIGNDDAFFGEINNELADKGFLVTSTDELINWARTGSLMWMTFGLACCAVEMMQLSMPRYDVARFGFAPRGLLRQWRRLLSLFLFGSSWLRSRRADRYLCSGLSPHGGGAPLRRASAAEENPPHRHDRALMARG